MNKVDKSGFASERLVLFFNLGYKEANRCNEIKWLFWEGMQKKKFKAHYFSNVAINIISSRKAWQILSIPKTTLSRLWSTNKSNIATSDPFALLRSHKNLFDCPILSRLKKKYDYLVI